jgi:hypothetical protein
MIIEQEKKKSIWKKIFILFSFLIKHLNVQKRKNENFIFALKYDKTCKLILTKRENINVIFMLSNSYKSRLRVVVKFFHVIGFTLSFILTDSIRRTTTSTKRGKVLVV